MPKNRGVENNWTEKKNIYPWRNTMASAQVNKVVTIYKSQEKHEEETKQEKCTFCGKLGH